MVKLVLDADGAIKLAKSGALPRLCSVAKCFMPKEVYREVLRGKEKMYEDAFTVEELARGNKIKLADARGEHRSGLGAGEIEVLALFKEINADAVVSDDRKFLSVLEAEEIPFIIPSDAIALLAVKKIVSKQEAIKYLDKISHLVRRESYDAAREKIGGD